MAVALNDAQSPRVPGSIVAAGFAGVALYAWVLHWIYSSLIVPAFGYIGYTYAPPDAVLLTIAWLLASINAVLLKPTMARPSSILITVLFVVVVGPAILMAPYFGRLDNAGAFTLLFGVHLAFALVTVGVRQRRAIRPLPLRISSQWFWRGLVAFSTITYGYLAVTAGLSIELRGILEVYDVRAEYSAALAGAPGLGYFVGAQSNAVNPFVIAWGLARRRWSVALLAVTGQLVLYSVTGFKTVLFSLAALALVYILLRRRDGSPLLLLYGAAAMTMVTATIDIVQNQAFWSSFLVRRFIITPAQLTTIYYEFYSGRPKEQLAHSTLEGFVTSPYPAGPSKTISAYEGFPDASMNANLFADGYAQFGWVGVLGAAGLLILFLRMVDRASVGLPPIIPALVMVMPAVTLSNASILTSMLTHGLFAVFMLLALAPRELERQDQAGLASPVKASSSRHPLFSKRVP